LLYASSTLSPHIDQSAVIQPDFAVPRSDVKRYRGGPLGCRQIMAYAREAVAATAWSSGPPSNWTQRVYRGRRKACRRWRGTRRTLPSSPAVRSGRDPTTEAFLPCCRLLEPVGQWHRPWAGESEWFLPKSNQVRYGRWIPGQPDRSKSVRGVADQVWASISIISFNL